jgi:hypothetical protein
MALSSSDIGLDALVFSVTGSIGKRHRLLIKPKGFVGDSPEISVFLSSSDPEIADSNVVASELVKGREERCVSITVNSEVIRLASELFEGEGIGARGDCAVAVGADDEDLPGSPLPEFPEVRPKIALTVVLALFMPK